MRLEIGKRYITRRGLVTGPIYATGDPGYPFAGECAPGVLTEWRDHGGVEDNGSIHLDDIVREIVEDIVTSKVKIIQLLMTPNDSTWQGVLLGLGDDGVTYHCRDGYWDLYIPSLANVELVHPLPAAAEDELGVWVVITEKHRNTAAGSGLHEASCSDSYVDAVLDLDTRLAARLAKIPESNKPTADTTTCMHVKNPSSHPIPSHPVTVAAL